MLTSNQYKVLAGTCGLLALLILVQIIFSFRAQKTATAMGQLEGQLINAQRSEMILRQLAARVAKASEQDAAFKDVLAKAEIKINPNTNNAR